MPRFPDAFTPFSFAAMSKIFLYLAAVFLLLTAGLSFANKGKLTAKNDEIKRANGVASAAQTDATKARTALKESDKKLGEQTAKAADIQTQLAVATNDLAKLKDEAKAAADNLATKDQDLARQAEAIKLLTSGKPVPVPGGSDADELAKAKTERDELKTVNDSLQNRVKGMEGQVADLQRRVNEHQLGVTKPGLTGRVLAVDRNWNFVVLSLGDRNGVNSNTTMVVRRGESLVGRVRITSVEPSQSIADIVPNSVPPGVSVEAGDTVIFPGS